MKNNQLLPPAFSQLHSAAKFLAIVLTLSLIIMPVPSVRAEKEETGKYSSEGIFIVCEETERREKFEKHFLLSDGSSVAVSYPEAVHTLTADGQWAEIDNRLSLQGDFYSNKAGTVSLPKYYTGETYISLNNEEQSLSWQINVTDSEENYLTKAEAAAEIYNDDENQYDKLLIDDCQSFAIPGITATAVYRDAFSEVSGIDAKYTLSLDKIEEDVILNNPADITSFVMSVQANGMTARVNDDRTVTFLNNGAAAFTVDVPYMVDSADAVLTNIAVDIETNENEILIKYTPDSQWLASEERVYPITFDPSVTTKEYRSNIIDTYVMEDSTENYSTAQLLYFGVISSKICRAYLKIGALPTIDSSMPILSARMYLSLWTGTSTGKAAVVSKVCEEWDENTITYANKPSATQIETLNFNSSDLHYDFNISGTVIEDFYAGECKGFEIKYADESLVNPDYNTFYSVESGNASLRPVITIIYGYCLPSGLAENSTYSMMNTESLGFLTVHNGLDANGTNVYQQRCDVEDITDKQRFTLEKVESTGAYLFRAKCSSTGSGRVLDIAKSNGYVESGCNVQIYTNTDPLAQEWFIIGVGELEFRIVPRTNMGLALTAYPSDSDGTSEGRLFTSVGNIFVSEIDEENDYQCWYFIDESNPDFFVDGSVQTFENGIYYINNAYTGKYLVNSSGVYCDSGMINNLGDTISWRIHYAGNDRYTIRSETELAKFLGISEELGVYELTTEMPEEYLWSIQSSYGGGVCIYIGSGSTALYLTGSGGTVCLSSSRGETGSDLFKKTTWRIAFEDYCNARELNSNFTISDMAIDVGETAAIIVNKSPSDAMWADKTDFICTTCDNSKVSVNNCNVTGLARGSVSITVSHKATGLTKTFSVLIFPGTFEVYIFASDISLDSAMENSNTWGHGWIEIISNSAHAYTIGHYTLPAGESVTIGRWGTRIDQSTDGNFVGVWYNREIYEININNKFISKTYSFVTVEKTQINQISDLIISSYNGYNFATNNCVKFAIAAWNLCVDSDNRISTSIFIPNQLRNAIENLEQHYSGMTTCIPGYITCGFYNGINYVEHSFQNSQN